MPTNKSKTKKIHKQTLRKPIFSMRQFVIFGLTFGVVGSIFLALTNAQSPTEVKPFAENAKKGLHWSGIRPGMGACDKAYELVKADQPIGCTHGPDPAPAGLDATASVEPLTNGVTANLSQSASGIVCDGDGSSGYRVQALYAHASDVPDRFSQYAASFQQYAATINNIMVDSGNQSGSARSIRFATDSSCNVSVVDVTLSATGDDNFTNTQSELRNLGYGRTDRKYVVWMDANVYCGIGGFSTDNSPGQTNANNSGPSYGRVDTGCWGGQAEAHELMHNLGAVEAGSPNNSGGYHCNDGYDVMCYSDGGSTSRYTTSACPNSADYYRYDCNKNDYFNSSPTIASTNFLATSWNTANSRFLIGASAAPPPSAAAPTLSFSASPASIPAGGQSLLSWSSTNATSCTASGAWSGAKNLSGNLYTGALYSTSTYSLVCSGSGGNVSRSITVNVGSAAAAPTLSFSASPASIPAGGQSLLSWSSTNATSCTASGAWSGAKNLSGNLYTGALYSTSTYSLVCSGSGGNVSRSITVNVGSAAAAPTLSFSASPASIPAGGQSLLSWSSTNATSCTASGAWSGYKLISGTYDTGSLTTAKTYYLSCTGPGGSVSRYVTININSVLAPVINFYASPSNILVGRQANLYWQVSNANTCTAGGGWSGSLPTNGNIYTPILYTTTSYSITCTGTNGTATRYVTITVGSTNVVNVMLSASPTSVAAGTQAILKWSSDNATSCTARDSWSGTKALSGTEYTNIIYSTSTFTLSCSGPNGGMTRKVTINVANAASAASVDVTPPLVKVTSPSPNAVVGTQILGIGARTKISATATDNIKVENMQIFIDGFPATASKTNEISYDWNSKRASKGQHTVQITATDSTNNIGKATIMIIKH